MAAEGISVPQSGAAEIDPREYVVALSVVCRPAQTLDTVQLAFQASAASVGTVDRPHQAWVAAYWPSSRGKRGHLPRGRDHVSSYQPLCVKMHPASSNPPAPESGSLT